MSSNTPKTKTKASPKAGTVELHRQRETEAASLYADASAKAAAALAAIPHLADAVEETEDKIDEIKSQWAGGDASASAADLVQAEAEHGRAVALLAGAEATIRREERKAKSTDVSLAEIVADAVRDLMPWVEIVPTFLSPTQCADVSDSAVYVVQAQASKSLGGGEFSGTVEIVAGLDYRYRPVDVAAVARHLTGQGISVEVGQYGAPPVRMGSTEWNSRRIQIHSAHSAVPEILADPTDHHAKMLAADIAARAQRSASGLKVWRTTGKVTNVHTKDGERLATVEAVVTFSDHGATGKGTSAWMVGFDARPASADAALRTAVDNLAGEFVRGLGVVETQPVMSGAEANVSDHYASAVKVRATFRSKAPTAA